MGKMKHIPLLLLAAVLAVGCSQDDLFDPAGEGQRPLVIKATGLSVTETGITRATVDGDWKDASSVGILIDNKVKEYSVTPNADAPSTATLSAAQGVEPFYWVNEQETKNVKAWYPYKGEDAFPTEITVSENQSTKEGFEGSDRLSAENPLTENDCELEFSHRVAKVAFNLKGESTALDGLSDVTVVGVTGVDGGGNSVTPYQPDAAVHTYQALLVPQTLAAGKTALTLTKDNFTYAWIPDKDYKLEENYSYTFDLTVSNFDPNIKLTGCTITDWTDGGSYDENVPFPEGISFLSDIDTWDLNDGIGIYMVETGTQTVVDNAANRRYVTAAGDGRFSPASEDQTIYFPLDANNKVDFIAYYPQDALTGNTYAVDVTDQSDPAAIDLLWSNNATAQDKTVQTVDLKFYHRLSRVEVELKAGAGVSEAELAGTTVTLSNQPVKADFDVLQNTMTAAADVAEITLLTGTNGLSSSAIILPQDGTDGRTLHFAFPDGTEKSWQVEGARTFEQGKKTIFNITVNRDFVGGIEVEVTATIEPWEVALNTYLVQ